MFPLQNKSPHKSTPSPVPRWPLNFEVGNPFSKVLEPVLVSSSQNFCFCVIFQFTSGYTWMARVVSDQISQCTVELRGATLHIGSTQQIHPK